MNNNRSNSIDVKFLTYNVTIKLNLRHRLTPGFSTRSTAFFSLTKIHAEISGVITILKSITVFVHVKLNNQNAMNLCLTAYGKIEILFFQNRVNLFVIDKLNPL